MFSEILIFGENTMIEIKWNGEITQISSEMSVLEFLKSKNYERRGFAVAVNETFIPRNEYTTTMIKATDRIEVVAPMQGG